MSHESIERLERRDRIRAVLIAPLVIPALLFALPFMFSDNPLEDFDWGVLLGFPFAYLFSLAGFLVFGLPAIAILNSIGRLRICTLMLAGMIEGAVIGCLFFFIPPLGPVQPNTEIYRLLWEVGIFAFLGLLVAGVFGFIAKIRF